MNKALIPVLEAAREEQRLAQERLDAAQRDLDNARAYARDLFMATYHGKSFPTTANPANLT